MYVCDVKSASEYCPKLMDRFRCMPKICGILYDHVGQRGRRRPTH